ncbi:MAG: Lrp/AsnC ligand binding domain-containing protein [Candidatus Hermodarchaeota archaeon]|nr:Lrp/AsnC ligand binding domain-containing protein [Candidatus Hermodarchaeota archaeon]
MKVTPQQEDLILREISKISSISESHKLFGLYDIIVEIERKGMRDIMETVSKIRSLKGVMDTITNLVADFEMDVHGAPL